MRECGWSISTQRRQSGDLRIAEKTEMSRSVDHLGTERMLDTCNDNEIQSEIENKLTASFDLSPTVNVHSSFPTSTQADLREPREDLLYVIQIFDTVNTGLGWQLGTECQIGTRSSTRDLISKIYEFSRPGLKLNKEL